MKRLFWILSLFLCVSSYGQPVGGGGGGSGGSVSVSDSAYNSGWDGSTTTAPSQNSMYDWMFMMDPEGDGPDTFPGLAGVDEINAAEALPADSPRSGYGGTPNTRHFIAATTDVEFVTGIANVLGRTMTDIDPSGGDGEHDFTLPATPDYVRTYTHTGSSGIANFPDFGSTALDSEGEQLTAYPSLDTDGSTLIWRAVVKLNGLPAMTSADLRSSLSDESGTGAALFAGGAIGAATVTAPSAGDSSTLVPSSAWVQTEIDATQTGTHASPSTTDPLSPTWSGPVHTVWYGATGEINLPAAAGYVGRGIRIYNTGAFTITIDPDGSEVIVRDGNVQTGGVTFTLSSGAGNFVGIISDGARWITVGYKGTLAVGS